MDRVAWRSLFEGMNSVHYFGAFMGWSWSGLVDHDFSANPVNDGFLQSIRNIKSGPGKLLIASDKIEYGMGVHYCYVNTFVSEVLPFRWQPLKLHRDLYRSRMEEVRSAMTALIEDCQLQNT